MADGSMESIDEHCKNFATSSWTQFKVGLKKEEEKNTGSGAVYPDVLLHHEGRDADQPPPPLPRPLRPPHRRPVLGYW